jgi:hypothetical protein
MAGNFGFGIRAGTTSCPQMIIEVQHYEDQKPVEFTVESCFGTPTIRFSDDTVLVIHKNGDSYEYILTVSKTAMARVKKQYEE